jgi:GT2 family glycosyltransferase
MINSQNFTLFAVDAMETEPRILDRGRLIFVSFYKSPELVKPLFDSLLSCSDDLQRAGARVVFCNDSPGHIGLAEALSECRSASGSLNIEFIENKENIGFLRSANRALADAAARGEDVLLLNSDTVFFPGVLAELIAVAHSDPMIGFVSPRSNNATLCTFPHGAEKKSMTPREAFDAFSVAAYRLPRASYAPTCVGFCLFIKWEILAEFGWFDEIYNGGYNEENDLIMRANRHGYRAAIANHAFVWHAGESSFSKTHLSRDFREQINSAKLIDRYPEFNGIVESYMSSPEFNAERLISACARFPHNLSVGFDFSDFGCYHNGTFEAGIRLLDAAIDSWPCEIEVIVFISKAAWDFHELGRFRRAQWRDVASDEVVSAIVRMGQPFSSNSIANLMRRAPVVSVFMLDTIAFDCGYLRIRFNEDIWHFAMRWCDVIFTNSTFTAQQFRRRFKINVDGIIVASPHSYTPLDYVKCPPPNESLNVLHFDEEPYILVVGNKFEHKALETTVKALAIQLPTLRFVALGLEQADLPNVRCVAVGQLDEREVDALYNRASCVVYPSHYEGFGFPLMHALARRKPVLVRPLPPFKEAVAAMRDGGSNVIWFETTAEICKLLQAGVPEWRGAEAVGEESGWRRSADEVLGALTRQAALVQYEQIVDRLRWLGAVAPSHNNATASGKSYARMGRVEAARQFLSYYPAVYWIAARIWRKAKKLLRWQ